MGANVDTAVCVKGGSDLPSAGQTILWGQARLLDRNGAPPDLGPYSYREIAAGIADHAGAMTAAQH
jgi:hypothetical protein